MEITERALPTEAVWKAMVQRAECETGDDRIQSDWSIYVQTVDSEQSYIMTSVDDMLIASSSTAESDAIVNAISLLFEITDNGTPTFHLGCSITCNRDTQTLKLDQQTYIQSILHDFGMEICNPVHMPMLASSSNLRHPH